MSILVHIKFSNFIKFSIGQLLPVPAGKNRLIIQFYKHENIVSTHFVTKINLKKIPEVDAIL